MELNFTLWHVRSMLIVVLVGCSAQDASNTLIIGHGGAGQKAEEPMNSRASMERALGYGVEGVELDVQLSADSVLVAYHAQDLGELTSCDGLINSLTWNELRNCHVVSRSGESFAIVRLDSLLSGLAQKRPDIDITLDCKLFAAGEWWPYLRTYARAIVALNRIPPIQGHLNVECQVDAFLLLLQSEQPYIPLYRYATDMEEAIWRAVTSHFHGIVVSNDRANREQVRMAQELGLEVTLFGVGGRWSHFIAMRKGPDRLQTDAPELFH